VKLHIKHMVSNRCKMAVQKELKQLGLHFSIVGLGEVDVMESLSLGQREQLNSNLIKIGLELIDNNKTILVEKIKITIIETVQNIDKNLKINFSHYLSETLNHDYTYLANLFSQVQGTTIEQFFINHKIEKAKELLTYAELSIAEISLQLNYSSPAHLSTQFKKVVGVSPSQFLKLKENRRKPIDDILKLQDESLLPNLDKTTSVDKISIFIVDDDVIFLKFLELQFIEVDGFVVKTFSTGELCMEHLIDSPDIIILDYHLNSTVKKAMTGLETLIKIKALNTSFPVIMLSAQDNVEIAIECLHNKAVDYVVKNETSFLNLQKNITTILSYIKIKKQLNWFNNRL
jgi:AraC-like DNA-binding protein/ActR/RegA family two-component response regulator